ncbi:MAG TPA: S8 family serine peptidase [Candidatus Eisenbacteria bacterium]|nr:S8 family serine peptidase [Candidatus Eisenbacteria bacterium]
MPESAVRFACELPAGAERPAIVLSRRPFDPSGWTALPQGDGFIVRALSGPITSLADAGLAIDRETPVWWAVAHVDGHTGALRVSEVRSFTAEPRFMNTIAASPYLGEARRGIMGRDEIEQRVGVASAATPRGPARIRLSAGYDFAPAEGAPKVPAELATPVGSGKPDGLQGYLVQFEAMPTAAELARITGDGGAVVAYIPDQAYLVRMSPAAGARLAAEPGVAWVGDYLPAYKLSPLIDRAATGSQKYTALLFADTDVAATSAALTVLGAAVIDTWDNGINKMVRFETASDLLPTVASLVQVAWVEPVVPLELSNDQAQWVVQTNISNNRRVWDMGIRGQGQIVMTSDSGIQVNHEMFVDPLVPIADFGDYPTHRKIIAYKKGSTNPAVEFGDHPGAVFHGTHTACTVTGNDAPAGAVPFDGMAPEAKIYFMDIGGTTLLNGVDAFPDLNDLFQPPYTGNTAGGARVSSHSWGGATAGAYTLHSLTADQFLWNHKDFYAAFATGNSGTAGSVGSPSTAKNVTSAGGTENGTGPGIYTSTSRGPCQDGRRKPTFSSPAVDLISASGTPGSYAPLSGTSMATPCQTGAIALVRQYCTEGWYPTGAKVPANGFAPSAALLKAMGVNAAANVVSGFTAPDNNVGFGKISIDNVLYFAGDAKKLLLVDQTDGLGSGQFIEYQVNVVDGAVPLEVSLCWTDFPGNPAAAIQLVNNLNLTVSKGATVYKGNVYSGGSSITGGTYDDRNVEEAVLVGAPATGVWTVRIDAVSVPMGPQPFGLCITGGVGTNAGTVAMDRAEYGSTSTVELRVTDTNAGATVGVQLVSSTESTPLAVTLTGANGIYTGTATLTPASPSAGDGLLSVSHGDQITATYQDASPAATLAATATVSLATPIISNVRAMPQGTGRVQIAWDTNINASSRVYYGLTPSLELGSADGSGAPLTHTVDLSGLTQGATYYYDVESVALSGNLARDDMGGLHHKFTVKAKGDILLVYGADGFERAVAWEGALSARGYDFDTWGATLANAPPLGDLAAGLRSYAAVLWQPGFEEYPAFTDLARTAVTSYLDGGGRMLVNGHDICWGMSDPQGPAFSVDRRTWVQNTLKAIYQADPATWSQAVGIAGDPITGSYVAGIPYQPFREGGAGDEVDINPLAPGTSNYIFLDGGGDATPDHVAFRWQSATPNGSAATAFWGGQPSRLVNFFLEFTALDPPFTSPSTTRADLLDKTILWLMGRPRPVVHLTSPNGGEVITGNSVPITWTETPGPGRAIASRSIDYSLDGGSSWATLATGVGPSPYAWNLATTPNTIGARVRIRVVDNGAPALSATDASDASFSLDRANGDGQGPVVVAGSIASSPNPIHRPDPATLTASISDQETGSGTVTAAEWSTGTTPAPAGTGTAMSGAFGSLTVDVSAALNTSALAAGQRTLWVRGRDDQGNWGPASSLTVQVNGTGVTGIDDGTPAVAFLAQNAPNPSAGGTTIAFGLTRPGAATLDVFDAQGRRVRRLADGEHAAGVHRARWDGRDESGSRLHAGLYFYRLITSEGRFERRMALIQ